MSISDPRMLQWKDYIMRQAVGYAQQSTQTGYDPEFDGPDTFGQVSVPPRNMAKFIVGMYEKGMTPPELFVEVTPQSAADGITSSLATIDGSDCYTLVCSFQNFGDSPCKVIVRNGAFAH